MSLTEDMVNNRGLQLEEQSPTLMEFDSRQQEEIQVKRSEAANQMRNSDWFNGPVDTTIESPEGGKEVQLTASDDHLPYLADIQTDYDLVQQFTDDQANGTPRPPGQYAQKYVQPNKRTVMGVDLANGTRHWNTADFNVPGVEHHVQRGTEILRESTNSAVDGPDDKTIQGLSHIAQSIQLQGGDFNDLKNAAEALQIPDSSVLLGWNAAARAQGQQEAEQYITAPVTEQEVQSLPPPPPQDLDSEDLVNEAGWMDSAKFLWDIENAAEFQGSPEELNQWALNEMSNFNWRIVGSPGVNGTSMAYYATQAALQGKEYAQALLNLIETYDRVNTDLAIIGRSLGAVATDPTTYAGLGAGKLGAQIASRVAKNRLQTFLIKASTIGATEGAAFAGGENLARQSVQVDAGAREEISGKEAATMAAAGGAVGAALGPVVAGALSPYAMKLYRKGGQRMLANARKGGGRSILTAQTGAVGDLAGFVPFSKPDIPDDLQPMATLNNSNTLAESRQFQNKRELKLALQEMTKSAMNKAGVDLLEETEETNRILAEVLLDDAKAALKTNANAIGWYDKTVAKAMRTLELMHPELATDPDAKTAFTYALAVTSNGMKVDRNFKLAEAAYRIFKGTGKMPTDIGEGKQGSAMNTHMEMWNNMVDEIGIDGLRTLFDSKTTVGALKKAGFSVGGEHVATEVYGSAIIGPKIGNGFYSNLNGKFDQLTMDLWLRRTYGRITGDLIRERPDMVAKKRTQVKQAVRNLRQEDPKTLKAIEAITGKLYINSGDALDKAGLAIAKATMLPANRTVMNAHPSGADLRKAGNGLAGYLDNQIDVPSAAERVRIRKLFNLVLDDLKTEYPDLTMADLQALLWYPEKRLYDKAKSKDDVSGGYTDDEAPDYANAAAALAAESGIDKNLIKEAQANVESTGRADPAGRPRTGGKPEQGQDQSSGAKKTGEGNAAGKRGSGPGGVTQLDSGASDVAITALGDTQFSEEVARHTENLADMPEYADFVIGDLENKLSQIKTYTSSAAIDIASDLIALSVAGAPVKPKSIRKAVKVISETLSEREASFKAMEAAFLMDEIARNDGKDFVSRRLKQKDYERLYAYLDDLRDDS